MVDNIRFLLSHRTEALKVAGLRLSRKILDDFEPTNYLEMFFLEAVRAYLKDNPKAGGSESVVRGGIEAWPVSVQKEMKAGEIIHPDGRHPEHPNV